MELESPEKKAIVPWETGGGVAGVVHFRQLVRLSLRAKGLHK